MQSVSVNDIANNQVCYSIIYNLYIASRVAYELYYGCNLYGTTTPTPRCKHTSFIAVDIWYY